MACPVQVESLLSGRDKPGTVEVKLTPHGGVAYINREAAGSAELASWVADRMAGREEALPYFVLAGHLGLEQRATMIVMAAVHVGHPARFKMYHEPEGMPADPTGIAAEIKKAFMASSLAGSFPKLQLRSDVPVPDPVVAEP